MFVEIGFLRWGLGAGKTIRRRITKYADEELGTPQQRRWQSVNKLIKTKSPLSGVLAKQTVWDIPLRF